MRRVPTAFCWLALIAMATLLPAQIAWAHAQFTGSDPAAGAILENSPNEIILTFSQPVTPVNVTLADSGNAIVDAVGEAIANGERVLLPVTEPLEAGLYSVSYRVLSSDLHSISGEFHFSIGTSSAPVEDSVQNAMPIPVATPVAELPASPTVRDPVPSDTPEKMIRVAFVLAVLLGVGLVIFRHTITLPDSLDSWVVMLTRRTGRVGLILAGFYFLVAMLTVAGIDGIRPLHVYVMLQTSIGVSLLVAAVGFSFLSMSGRYERIVGGIGAAILLASRVLTGHPASQDPTFVLVPAMVVHVATAAFWFTSLWVLLRLLRKGPLADASQILGAFARIALWSVSALLLVGLTMAAIHVKSVPALFESDYGLLVVWKLAGVGGLLMLAMVNKLWLTPDLLERLDARCLRASIGVEAVLMIVVIAISTVLAATPPVARANTPISQSDPARISEHSDTGNYRLQVAFSSGPYDETQPQSLALFDADGNRDTGQVIEVADTITPDTSLEAQVFVTDFASEQIAFDREGRLEH